MAEIHIIGQIATATEFENFGKLFCKWSLQFGSCWEVIEGESEGQTAVISDRLEYSSPFAHPVDVHLATRSIQGWPKFHFEVYAVNALSKCFPVGYGFTHVPTQPGNHKIEVQTWKVTGDGLFQSLIDRVSVGGFALAKADLVFSGIERYKLLTKSSGKVILELSLIFRNFQKFGIEYRENVSEI